MEKYNKEQEEAYRIERQNAPDSTIIVDHWEGSGDEFNPYMAMKQYEARKDHEWEQRKKKWEKEFENLKKPNE